MSPAKSTKKKRGPSKMTPAHKKALAEGRAQGRAVRYYLEALEASKPKRGPKRTSATIQKRLDRIDADLVEADALRRLALVQERIDLLAELASLDQVVDTSALEAGFVDAAKGYSERKGITWAAWRQVGVPAAVLTAAGVPRTRG